MDDGYLSKQKRFRKKTKSNKIYYTSVFCTDAFSDRDCATLIGALNQLGIVAAVRKSSRSGGKRFNHIQTSAASTVLLHKIISPYVPPSMRYKLVDSGNLQEFNPDVYKNEPPYLPHYTKVLSIEEPKINRNTVYCIEVEDNHNFLCGRILAKNCFYDPWQFESSAQRLRDKGLPMYAWPQTQPNTIKMTEHLLDKLSEKGLVMYPDDDLRDEAKMVSIKEVPGRGRRMVKDNKNKKIDSVIALSMAALAATTHLPDFDTVKDNLIFLKLHRH
jgi:hypothetical protein